MNGFIPVWRRFATVFIAALVAASAAQAQATNPNGSPYPYWATAPQSYYPSPIIVVPAPAIFPNIISNAAPPPVHSPGLGSGIGGTYVPPFLRASDASDNRAYIWLRVPADAEIWVNEVKTKQSGETRYFFSPSLTPGKTYSYQMRLRWTKDGKPVEQTQRIQVRAGETVRRDFIPTP